MFCKAFDLPLSMLSATLSEPDMGIFLYTCIQLPCSQ